MKAQTKALVASVVVIALALTAVSGITYSWFSDTENANISINTGSLDVSTSDYTLKSVSMGINESADSVPSAISITYGGTGTTSASDIYISEEKEPNDLDITISYNVTFKASLGYQYIIGISVPSGVGYSASAIKSGETTAKVLPLKETGSASLSDTLNVTYAVSITITSLPSGMASGSVVLTNYITQKAANVVDDLSSVTAGSKATIISNAPTNGSDSTPVTVNFSEVPANAGNLSTEIETNSAQERVKVSLTLNNVGGGTITNVGKTTVSFTISGYYTDVMYYNTEGASFEQPTGVSFVYYDNSGNVTTDPTSVVKSKISFITNHFSEFVAFKDVFQISKEDDLKAALNAGLEKIQLSDDVSIYGFTIKDGQNLNIDLNSKTMSVSEEITIVHGLLKFSGSGKVVGCNIDEKYPYVVGIIGSKNSSDSDYSTLLIDEGVTLENPDNSYGGSFGACIFYHDAANMVSFGSKIIVKGAIVADWPVYANGSIQSESGAIPEIIITGATLTGEQVYIPGLCKTTIEDSDLNCTLYFKGGSIDYSNNRLNLKIDNPCPSGVYYIEYHNGAISAYDSAIYIDQLKGYAGVDPIKFSGDNTFTITDASGNSLDSAYYVAYTLANDSEISANPDFGSIDKSKINSSDLNSEIIKAKMVVHFDTPKDNNQSAVFYFTDLDVAKKFHDDIVTIFEKHYFSNTSNVSAEDIIVITK